MAAVDPGSIVQPGQELARISRTDTYEVRAGLPASATGHVRKGQTVQLTSRNLGRQYQATVNRFGTAVDPATQTITAFLRLSGPELRSGLYLEGEVAGQSLTDVAVLPKEALSRDGRVYVIIDGVVRTKAVEVSRHRKRQGLPPQPRPRRSRHHGFRSGGHPRHQGTVVVLKGVPPSADAAAVGPFPARYSLGPSGYACGSPPCGRPVQAPHAGDRDCWINSAVSPNYKAILKSSK